MTDPDGPAIVIAEDAAQGATAAAERLADAFAGAVAGRGRADFATTGGSAAPALYRALLAPGMRDRIPWGDLHVWWGDDRFVPRGDPDSNVTLLDDVLLGGDPELGLPGAPLPTANIHPVHVAATIAAGGDQDAAARAYARDLAGAVRMAGPVPAFDAVVVGVGPDGHLLSVFPGSAVFDADPAAIAVGVPAPTHVEPHVARVTLHPAMLDATGTLLVVAFGGGKSAIIARLLAPDGDPRQLPARVARRPGATWVLDRAAARDLAGSTTGS